LAAKNKELLKENQALYRQNKKGIELLEAEKEQITAKLTEKMEREKKRRTDGDIYNLYNKLLILCYYRMSESCDDDPFTSGSTCRRVTTAAAISQ